MNPKNFNRQVLEFLFEIGSIAHQFHSVVRSNYDIDQTLKLYYQKASPSQYKIADVYLKELNLLDGSSLPGNQRKILYEASFK